MKIFCLPFFGSSKSSQKTKPDIIDFENFSFAKELKRSTYPVYLVSCSNFNFALKVFPFKEDTPSIAFQRELIIRNLSHPNIIKILYSKQFVDNISPEFKRSSVIIMELAPFGNLFDAIWKHNLPRSEIIARTFFHQLIEGLEYLHNQEIAHTDIKPENLLIGENYILKIIDFERAKNQDSDKIPGRGTKNYRAPEIRSR